MAELRIPLGNCYWTISEEAFLSPLCLKPEGVDYMAISIATKLGELINDCGADVETEVIEALVGREVKRRSEALVQAIDSLAKMENEIKRFKPDIVLLNEEGKETSANYSPAKFKERKELSEKINKYTNAINKALGDKHDFGDVYSLTGSAKQSPPKDKKEGEGEAG